MNLLIIIQAYISSTRLPGKVLMPLAGEPLLLRMVQRVQAASTRCATVVATTTDASDEPIRELCARHEITCYSGNPTDLLDRHYRAALEHGTDAVAKIPSDCPLIDPGVIDKVLGTFMQHHGEFDFISNLHPATYPDGNDVEVMPFSVLETAWREATRPFEREHTTPFIWERPERFRIGNVAWETGLNYSMSHRWTIDYPEDYAFIEAVYDELISPSQPAFTMDEILALLERRPDIHAINSQHAGLNWYRHHVDELRTITAEETKLINSPSLLKRGGRGES